MKPFDFNNPIRFTKFTTIAISGYQAYPDPDLNGETYTARIKEFLEKPSEELFRMREDLKTPRDVMNFHYPGLIIPGQPMS
jgi:hypothetical protein